uniref:Uncharacterized protein n=1 Tax=Panagrolaimus superbus TaxID=310955 RepID=A0A914Z130_9BILA
MADLYAVRRIISSKKEKGKTLYLVDWIPSYTEQSNIPKSVIDEYKIYKNGATIIGPYEPSTKNKDKKDWKWVVQLGDQFEVVPHEEVAQKYKDELIKYFMEQTVLTSSTSKSGTNNNDQN